MTALLRRIPILTAVLALAVVLPSQARAQDVLEVQTDSAISLMDAQGFKLKQFRVGGLAQGAGQNFTITAPAGKSGLLMAICDQDCSDLDLKVTSGSRDLGSDVAPDDAPLVIVENFTGPMTVRVEMATCRAAPCGFSLMYFVK